MGNRSERVGQNGVGYEKGVDANGGDEGLSPGVLEGGKGGFEGGALVVEGEETVAKREKKKEREKHHPDEVRKTHTATISAAFVGMQAAA